MEEKRYTWIVSTVDTLKSHECEFKIVKDKTVDEMKKYIVDDFGFHIRYVNGYFIAGCPRDNDLLHYVFADDEDKTVKLAGWCIYGIETVNPDFGITDTVFQYSCHANILDSLLEEYDRLERNGVSCKKIKEK